VTKNDKQVLHAPEGNRRHRGGPGTIGGNPAPGGTKRYRGEPGTREEPGAKGKPDAIGEKPTP